MLAYKCLFALQKGCYSQNFANVASVGEEVPRMALREQRPKSFHSKDKRKHRTIRRSPKVQQKNFTYAREYANFLSYSSK